MQHFEFREGDTVNPYEVPTYPDGPPIGLAKGLRQIMWERGLLNPTMKKDDMVPVLSACHDFATEKTLLEKRITDRGRGRIENTHSMNVESPPPPCVCVSIYPEPPPLRVCIVSHALISVGCLFSMTLLRGHILIMSPKGHLELAGMGIEYSWGKAKREFRQRNDLQPKNLHVNICNALSTADVLPLDRVRRFARKTRQYKRAYSMLHGLFGYTAEDALAGFKAVEKSVK